MNNRFLLISLILFSTFGLEVVITGLKTVKETIVASKDTEHEFSYSSLANTHSRLQLRAVALPARGLRSSSVNICGWLFHDWAYRYFLKAQMALDAKSPVGDNCYC